jgi:hypothetical protein
MKERDKERGMMNKAKLGGPLRKLLSREGKRRAFLFLFLFLFLDD